MSYILAFVFIGSIPCVFAFIDGYIKSEYRDFDNFFELHPFLGTLCTIGGMLMVIGGIVAALWFCSTVLSPDIPKEERKAMIKAPMKPQGPTILTRPDGSKTVKVTVGSKIKGMPNVKEVKIELTVDSVVANDVHYTQDIIKDVIKKINR